ncbi:hypothetical protein PMM47T1_28682, partial [Pseudomonas sp. M47T1]|uniref:effector protein Tle3 domain-containing protein n=1 Tax=Pseudomonas sp. M47T1 TaxID=1179778 RepID=UPI000260845A
GTFGVPDQLPDRTPALDRLHGLRFYQRLWSKRRRHDLPIPVGDTPGPVALRDKGEGGTALPKWSFSAIVQRRSSVGETRRINAEALVPVHQPDMFGGEHTPGIDRPDAVSQNNALGNPKAHFKRIAMGYRDKPFDVATEQARWNDGKEDEDCAVFTQAEVEEHHHKQRKVMYQLRREETPNEIRARMALDPAEWEANSYHSAVLRSAVNHQWVTAMDIAIGQGQCLDDPEVREVLLAMADWRMTEKQYANIKELPGLDKLSLEAQAMIEAVFKYYDKGIFPSPDLVPLTLPSLVKGQLPGGEASQ